MRSVHPQAQYLLLQYLCRPGSVLALLHYEFLIGFKNGYINFAQKIAPQRSLQFPKRTRQCKVLHLQISARKPNSFSKTKLSLNKHVFCTYQPIFPQLCPLAASHVVIWFSSYSEDLLILVKCSKLSWFQVQCFSCFDLVKREALLGGTFFDITRLYCVLEYKHLICTTKYVLTSTVGNWQQASHQRMEPFSFHCCFTVHALLLHVLQSWFFHILSGWLACMLFLFSCHMCNFSFSLFSDHTSAHTSCYTQNITQVTTFGVKDGCTKQEVFAHISTLEVGY